MKSNTSLPAVILFTFSSLLGLGCPYYGGGGGGGGGYSSDDGCIDSFDCDDLDFCNVGECDQGLDRRYRISILSGEALTSGPDGSWDVGGGAPDLFIQWGVRDSANDEWIDDCYTSTVQDSFDPEWNEYCEFVLGSGDTFAIWGWDEDVSASDFAGGGYWQGSDAVISVIRTSGTTQQLALGDYLDVTFLIEPTF